MRQVIIMSYPKRKKGLAYYIRMFISATVAVLLVAVLSEITGWPSEGFVEAIEALGYLPFMIIIFLFIFNFVTRKIPSPVDKKETEHEFVMRTSKRVRKELEYDKESFKKLQASEKFQKFYQDAFQVYLHGESQENNLDDLLNRFGDQEFASDAAEIVVDETRKMLQEKKGEETSPESSSTQEENKGD